MRSQSSRQGESLRRKADYMSNLSRNVTHETAHYCDCFLQSVQPRLQSHLADTPAVIMLTSAEKQSPNEPGRYARPLRKCRSVTQITGVALSAVGISINHHNVDRHPREQQCVGGGLPHKSGSNNRHSGDAPFCCDLRVSHTCNHPLNSPWDTVILCSEGCRHFPRQEFLFVMDPPRFTTAQPP